MIETLISSKTRVKLLLKFFLNSNSTSYLRGLESEFGESSNAIRLELNRFESAGMLTSYSKGNKKYFRANTEHPLFNEVHNIILKYIGFDKIIYEVVERLGDVDRVYVTGDFAKGLNSDLVDLIFIGDVNTSYLVRLIDKTEKLIHRRIRYITYTHDQADDLDLVENSVDHLLLWANESN